jgi:hypothetical protein
MTAAQIDRGVPVDFTTALTVANDERHSESGGV